MSVLDRWRSLPPYRRPVFIGQAPGPSGGEGWSRFGSFALFNLPRHSAGGRLFTLTGWSNAQYLLGSDRVNLIEKYPGRAKSGKGDAFDLAQGAERADFLIRDMELNRRQVVLVGQNVLKSFQRTLAGAIILGRSPEPMSWVNISEGSQRQITGRWAWIPHTSGLNHFWNEPENQRRGHAFFEEFRAHCFFEETADEPS